jgi:hypothetical protein
VLLLLSVSDGALALAAAAAAADDDDDDYYYYIAPASAHDLINFFRPSDEAEPQGTGSKIKVAQGSVSSRLFGCLAQHGRNEDGMESGQESEYTRKKQQLEAHPEQHNPLLQTPDS